ncbi:MAG TPA: hypothetical protein VJP79_09420 [Nitrososphaera sp.]|nr:hypothetical protein [Nitrososphaera sp.]
MLKDVPYFKVWKVDEPNRSIDMTTYPTSSSWKTGRNEQVVAIVNPDRDRDCSVLRIVVTPSHSDLFVLADYFGNQGVSEKMADVAAKIIFEGLDKALSQSGA